MQKVMEGMRFNPVPLKRAYVVCGMGYNAIGERAGCSGRTVSAIINGYTPMSRFARPVAKLLGIDLNACWETSEEVA